MEVPYRFMTHMEVNLETKPLAGPAHTISGNYDQTIENAIIDFNQRVDQLRHMATGHSESCVCLRCRGIPVDEDGYPTQLKCVHNYLGRLKEIGGST